jgi:hypothetical protein
LLSSKNSAALSGRFDIFVYSSLRALLKYYNAVVCYKCNFCERGGAKAVKVARNIESELLTIDQFAERFHVSHWTVRAWINAGKIASVKLTISNRVLIPIAEADRIINDGMRPAVERAK